MLGNLNAALLLLDRALEEIENGFVACERCGDQEETKSLDFVDDLKSAKSEVRKALFSTRTCSHYDHATDIWSIHDTKWSGEALFHLATLQGETLTVTQVNGVTHLTRAPATTAKEPT